MPAFSIRSTLRRLATLAAGEPAPEPAGHLARWSDSGPVVLVGGFCTSELTLEPLRLRLVHLGYTVTVHTAGAGRGCGRRTVAELGDVVRRCADDAGEPVRLLGYSRGGQFARALTADPTVPVRSLVTLGTPFDLYGVSLPLRLQGVALAVAGTLGVPGLFTMSCFWGACCAGFRDDLRRIPDVPFVAIYSRADRLVRWQACVDPAARTVEVPGSHLGLLVDPEPLHAVAQALHGRDSAVTAA